MEANSLKKLLRSLLIALVVIVLLVLFGLYYIYKNDGGKTPTNIIPENPSTQPQPINPFGVVPKDITGQLNISPGIFADEPPGIGTIPYQPTDTTEEDGFRILKIFQGPVAGYRVDRDGGQGWIVRIVEAGRGNRYSATINPYDIKRVFQGDGLLIQKAHLFKNGKILIQFENQTNDLISQSFFDDFIPETDTKTIFENNVRVATNGENKLFFIKKTDGGSIGTLVDLEDSSNTRVIWKSNTGLWLPRWGRGDYITIKTPTAQKIPAHTFILNTQDFNPLPEKIFYSRLGGSVLLDESSGFLYKHENDISNILGKAKVTNIKGDDEFDAYKTFTEKCDGHSGIFICGVPFNIPTRTLSGYGAIYPDSWYQGDVVLSDAIVYINAVTKEQKIILNPKDEDVLVRTSGTEFDVVQPWVNDDGSLFFFVNKRDLSLWVIGL